MRAHHPRRPLLALALAAATLWAGGAACQVLDLTGQDGENVTVEAENGIEWHQADHIFLAKGNARANRGRVTVHADLLRAHYREKASGGSDIWRLDAEGRVRIETPGEKATGDLAVYEVEKNVLVLSGAKGVRLEAGADVVTARQQIEYWEKRRMAVARGNAMAKRDDKTLRADVLVAYIQELAGKSEIQRIEAFDNVHIETARDQVDATRGVYNVKTGMATLTGDVRIRRGGNLLNGCRAEVDLNSGVSKLFGCEDPTGRGRVSGTLRPERERRTLNP